MNADPQQNAGNRRNFLRNAALGGLLAIAGTLGARSHGQTCVNEGICRGCAAYDDCGLPQALSAKQARANLHPGKS